MKSWGEFAFLPDIFTVLPLVHAAGMLAVLVTNQRGIARGLMSEEDVTMIHSRMQQELHARCGHRFDAIYICPHERDAGCECRKPLPGMLLRAAEEYGIDLRMSWMIGDAETDIEAGLAAGCRAVLVADDAVPSRAEHVTTDLVSAWRYVSQKT